MTNTTNPNAYTGTEETVARILSFFASLVFFSIYSLSRGYDLVLNWSNLLIHVAIFWFVYELCSFGLFVILVQFSKNKKATESDSIITTNSQPNYSLDKNTDEEQK